MPDSEQTALRLVAAGSDPTPLIDVVFVHGLGGNGDATWRNEPSESWLNWLAEDIPSIAVWTLSYPAGATKWTAKGEGMAIPDRAGNLIPTLRYHGIGARRTVFVCHSLGGLIVKQVLRHSAEMRRPEWAAIADSTLGVAFLATPHQGSSLATFIQVIAVSRPTRTSLALKANCPHLRELSTWYRNNAARLGIETTSYAESRKVRRCFRTVMVVTPSSADPGVDGCITTSVDADHITIAKPTSRDSDTYRGIETFIRRQLSRPAAVNDTVSAGEPSRTSLRQNFPDPAEPPPELVNSILEVLALGDRHLLDPGEVSKIKIGIVNRYYGVKDD